MCGIAGYIGKEKIPKDVINKTLALMKQRGPDYQRSICFQEENRNIVLLHSRLSIIDLDKRSNQPFTLEHATVVFNGEIYNYVELREELEDLGYTFQTESDTEVLLKSYLAFGEKCVEKFEGMWSFAIYDSNAKRLFLSRDRFAEKPLYYFETSDGLYFGSEIKFLSSLAKQRFSVNHQHLLRYLVNGYRSLYKQSQTFFCEVQEVPYAANMIINDRGQKYLDKYWYPVSNKKDLTLDEAVEGVRERLLKSMKFRLRADVPLAFCLSGGIDSSSLVSIAVKKFNCDVATFSILDKDGRYNETDNIKATIEDLGCRHTLIDLEYGNTLAKLKELVKYHDAPVATISYLVHSYLSEAIHANGYRVAFSGTAADELFTGYYDHYYLHLYQMRNHRDYCRYLDDWKEHVSKVVRNPFFQDPEMYHKNPNMRQHIYLNNDVFRSYLKVPFEEEFIEEEMDLSLLRNRMMNELFNEVIPVLLHEDDLNSMKYSIENRSPFLDTELFEFACSIPEENLITNGYAKYVLRQAMDGILNDKVRQDRRKKGFNASITSVVDFDDDETKDYLLSDSPIYDWIKRDKMISYFQVDTKEDSVNKFLFSFINAKMFLEEFE